MNDVNQNNQINNNDDPMKVKTPFGYETADETLARGRKMLSELGSPAPAPAPIKAPDLPEPTAVAENEAFYSSLSGTVENTRKTLDDRLKNEIEKNQKEQDATQKRIDELTEKQEVVIDTDVEPLLTPFREDLENKERERLYINENFEANQKLTNELDALLTEGNNLISQEKERKIPNTFVTAKVNKKISDVSARAGVIEAVMNARSGQIAEAYRLIDRSVSAISADRQDRLAYYETVLNFYEGQKDTEGKKLINLESDEKAFMNEQITLLKGDLEQAEASANHIKSLMTDPESARFMADAGVTLNDDIDTINTKLAEQGRREEVSALKNELTAKGYTYVPFGSGRSDVETFEVGGQTLSFKPPVSSSGGSPGGDFTDSEKRKLEQAGLLGAPRQDQLDFLYGDNSTEKFSSSESLSAGYATRAEDAHTIINELDSEFTGAFSRISFVPENMKSEDRKKIEQAERNFINAILRKESGAAIADTEFASAQLQYFPQRGDTEEVLTQKARNRQIAISALKLEAGSAFEALNQSLPQSKAEVTVNGEKYPVGTILTNSQGQKGMINADGSITLIDE